MAKRAKLSPGELPPLLLKIKKSHDETSSSSPFLNSRFNAHRRRNDARQAILGLGLKLNYKFYFSSY